MPEHCYAECHLCHVSHLLSVTYYIFMQNVGMLNVIMLSVVAAEKHWVLLLVEFFNVYPLFSKKFPASYVSSFSWA